MLDPMSAQTPAVERLFVGRVPHMPFLHVGASVLPRFQITIYVIPFALSLAKGTQSAE
jgi:hypothetical protein